MVRVLEAGGGGSIRVGTTWTISALMTRELESSRGTTSRTPVSCGRRSVTSPVSVSCGTYSRRRQQRTSSNGMSSNGSLRSTTHSSQGRIQRKSCNSRSNAAHHVPILSSEDSSLDRTPNRKLGSRNGSCLVEIVDLKCGSSEKARSNPMANRLKKLSFSRLSQTIN